MPKSEYLEEVSRKVRSYRQARNKWKEVTLCNQRNSADENCAIHNMQPSHLRLIRQCIRKSTDIFKYMEQQIAGSPPEHTMHHRERHALFALIIHTRTLKDRCSSPTRQLYQTGSQSLQTKPREHVIHCRCNAASFTYRKSIRNRLPFVVSFENLP